MSQLAVRTLPFCLLLFTHGLLAQTSDLDDFELFLSDSETSDAEGVDYHPLFTFGGMTTTLRENEMSAWDRAFFEAAQKDDEIAGKTIDVLFRELEAAPISYEFDYLYSDFSNWEEADRASRSDVAFREIEKERGVMVFLNYQGAYFFRDEANFTNGTHAVKDENWVFFDLLFISTRSQKLLANLPIMLRPSLGKKADPTELLSELSGVLRQEATIQRVVDQVFPVVENESLSYRDALRILAASVDERYRMGISDVGKMERFMEALLAAAHSKHMPVLPPMEIDRDRLEAASFGVNLMAAEAFIPGDDAEYNFVESDMPLVVFKFGDVRNEAAFEFGNVFKRGGGSHNLDNFAQRAILTVHPADAPAKKLSIDVESYAPKALSEFPEARSYTALANLCTEIFLNGPIFELLEEPVIEVAQSSPVVAEQGSPSAEINYEAGFYFVVEGLPGMSEIELEDLDAQVSSAVAIAFNRVDEITVKTDIYDLIDTAATEYAQRYPERTFGDHYQRSVSILKKNAVSDQDIDLLFAGRMSLRVENADNDLWKASATISQGQLIETFSSEGNTKNFRFSAATMDPSKDVAIEKAIIVAAEKLSQQKALVEFLDSAKTMAQRGIRLQLKVYGGQLFHRVLRSFLRENGQLSDGDSDVVRGANGFVYDYRSPMLTTGPFPTSQELSEELGLEVESYRRGNTVIIADSSDKNAMKVLEDAKKFRAD